MAAVKQPDQDDEKRMSSGIVTSRFLHFLFIPSHLARKMYQVSIKKLNHFNNNSTLIYLKRASTITDDSIGYIMALPKLIK